MDIDLEGLRGFIVDNCVDTFDVETTGGQICGEEMGDFAISEGFNI